ncbi:hypothetical protein HELRODRAFT_161477 [Helobdella robusta]|uniref:Uncharacterized protein n=1 Tax=Helobdella robusta TaxID=6412 RepID=T1ERI5_HELRO|nr:hypothetical protein HELRODRAFT_161477 [Helobdella robusta]ESO02233.1 hypothetical protein HELRODRAFT_161477 [Helobdella robusta]
MEMSVIKPTQPQPFQPKTFKNVTATTSSPAGKKTTTTKSPHFNASVPRDVELADNSENGSHREMAIDCPLNFVEFKKEPPRYPRPLSLIQNTSLLNNGNNPNSIIIIPNQNNKGDADFNYENEMPSSVSFVSSKNEGGTQMQQNKMKKYKEDLQKRKEHEEKIQKEQEFLRTSLRGSKKLLELKEPKNKPSTSSGTPGSSAVPGIFNPNYVSEEELNRSRLKPTLISNQIGIFNNSLNVL